MKEKMSTMMDEDEDEDMKHCLTLRIWSLNTAMRGTLNDEHFQKGQQVDEWLREVNCTSLNELLELLYLSQLNPFQEEQMFSACIAGRRFLILNFLKDPEKRRKMIILLS
ncbi:hypothetical protein POM88_049129 [Heracleum sosnowskyi]|uniref:Uncharacterized protein n=1 Tax=Heracleum sosnowskyi TaxID=360622 RepID=A0AAD8GXP2_9APIA|nr:hypothetical protein POM88_049129 [Heracleum sosnowskyi]